jgi:hypothetical protein
MTYKEFKEIDDRINYFKNMLDKYYKLFEMLKVFSGKWEVISNRYDNDIKNFKESKFYKDLIDLPHKNLEDDILNLIQSEIEKGQSNIEHELDKLEQLIKE